MYRARDSRLKREVALKVLPQELASDAHRMARFEREAQVLASLNHPNIASIYGLEESGGVQALVMELVEGATLAEHIAAGKVPSVEAMSIARQIAEALEYAHERGIVHRDLKPANIKITPDGSVKVLDFGLAKAVADDSALPDSATSPTITAVATREGLIIGTAAYMSPEQARGRPVDRRADVWAFGCVVFEMLAGRSAFARESVTDTLASVLTAEPDLRQLPASTPPSIQKLIGKCLQKDVKRRLQSIGDARIEIEDFLSNKSSPELSPVVMNASERGKAKGGIGQWNGIAILAVLLLVSAVLIAWRVRSRTTAAPEWAADMLTGPSIAMSPRISPDGHTLAFQAMIDDVTQVAVTSPDTGTWTVLTHDRLHGFVNEITWSPDGSRLYYDRTVGVPVGIYSVPALGGAERLVLQNAGCPESLPDGSLLVIRADQQGRWQIYHFWPDSQRLQALGGWIPIGTTTPLRVFPDGKAAVFYGIGSESEPTVHLYLLDIATGKAHRFAPELPERRNNESYPIATSADNIGVFVEVAAGDLHRIVFVRRDGKGPVQTVMTLTKPPWYMESSKDGTLYLDQVNRPHEILRFPVSGGHPEVLGSSDTYVPASAYMAPVETSDGQFLLDTQFRGRGRLLIGKPGQDFVPVIDTDEETSSPATPLANHQVAFIVGHGSSATVVIASTIEGRIVRWLQGTKGRHLTALAASPDAKTIYFGADGYIWSIPADDGTAKKIAAGENVSVDPNGRDLVITQSVTSNPFLMKVSLETGKSELIHLANGTSLAPVPTGARAINGQEKMLINVSPPDSWFYRIALLDLRTGAVTPIKVKYAGDTFSSNWATDGNVTSVGTPLKSHIWHFRAAPAPWKNP